jgi:hypothetical protein
MRNEYAPKNSSTIPTGRCTLRLAQCAAILNICGAASQWHIPIDRRRRFVDGDQRCKPSVFGSVSRYIRTADHGLVCSFTERREAMSGRRPRRGQSNG